MRGASFGIVLLEGMAARPPVVASDLPGYRNVAATGREALLVPPGDATELASGLRRVLKDSALASSLVAAGELRAEQFAMDRLAETYVGLYERAIEHERAAGTVRPVTGWRRWRAQVSRPLATSHLAR